MTDVTDTTDAKAGRESTDAVSVAGLLETLGGDPSLLAELIDAYLDESPRLLARLRRAVGAGDRADLRLAAHSLKSSSATFGARALAVLCQDLERMAEGGAPASAAARLALVEAEYERVKAALQALRPAE